MKIFSLEDSLREIAGKENIKLNESMKNHTSFKIGGCADILALPSNSQAIIDIINICKQNGIVYTIIGNGSNLLISDKGIRGVVIKLGNNFNKVEVLEDTIYAEAGLLLSKLSNIALENGLSGIEFASGIPGTLGGAVVMNAGAYHGEMKDVVVSTEYFNGTNVKVLNDVEHEFSYRKSAFQANNGIVIKSKLKLQKAPKSEIKAMMDDLNKRRKDKQPLELPSAGSAFKRPEGYFAAKLIEDCGLKGFKVGGAEVSNKHCGFVVNTGNATAANVMELMHHVVTTVKDRFGILLEPEIKYIGDKE